MIEVKVLQVLGFAVIIAVIAAIREVSSQLDLCRKELTAIAGRIDLIEETVAKLIREISERN